MSIEQILAIIIFAVMFIAIMSGKIHRYVPALIGAALTALLILTLVDDGAHSLWQVLRLPDFVDGSWWFGKHAADAAAEGPEVGGVNWQTMIFIGGMMVMVEGMGAAGFFRWLCLLVARAVNYRLVPILITFMLLSAFLSMFIDSITVLLFLATVTIELARLLKFDPVPVIIAEIFAANTGGSATMSGDPPNIIIGTHFNYTFTDFLTNTGVIAWICMIVVLVLFYFFFRKVMRQQASENPPKSPDQYPQPREAIKNRRLFMLSTGIFILVVVLLVTHAQTGLSVGLIGCIAAALTIGAVVLAARDQLAHVVKGVDWRTLLFFFGLFMCVGGLEVTGVLHELARLIGDASGANLAIALTFILWVSAFASAIVDNIPFAATMCPVIASLSGDQGLGLRPLSWSLALGTDIGGNATPIGASANVVGTAIAEKEGYRISWGRYCKYAIPAMLLVVGICNIYLILRYA
ncbi:MAG: ArsB/NhaD family transporter [Dehalococcoidia bacterium]|nr:ArsB/NhaD family transporter [Dehalococcoidia bacterium]